MKTTFSIMIPFYSTADNDRTGMLESLLATIPDRHDVEVIVVDDLSEPACTVDPGYKYSTFKIIRMTRKTAYAGAARNLALSVATGDFLLCADSDDLFDTSVLSEIFDIVSSQGNPGHEVVVHAFRSVSFHGHDMLHPSADLYNNIKSNLFATDPAAALSKWHAPWAKIFSRNALKAGLEFAENDIVDDTPFSISLALCVNQAVLHDKIGYGVRRDHGVDALTSRRSSQEVRSRIAAYRDANLSLSNAGRDDLIIPMHHAFRSMFRLAPATVLKEVLRSAVRREKILPFKKNAPVT